VCADLEHGLAVLARMRALAADRCLISARNPRTDERTGERLRGAGPPAWDGRVEAWEEGAASDAFARLRDRICELAEPAYGDRVVDLGAGTSTAASTT
jgi:hypothetical protein